MSTKRNIVYYTGGRVINAVLSVATLFFVNYFIEPGEYGRFSFITMCSTYIALGSFGWIWTSNARNAAQKDILSNLRLSQYWVLLSIPVALFLIGLMAVSRSLTVLEFSYLFVFPVAVALFNSGQKVYAAHSLLLQSISGAVARSASYLLLLLLLTFTVGGDSSLYIANFFAYFVVVLWVSRREHSSQSRESLAVRERPGKADIHYGLGVALAALVTQLNYGMDKLVINSVLGDKSTGLYVQSYEFIFFFVMFVFSIYNISTYPRLIREYDAGKITLREILQRNFRWFLLAGVVLVFFLLLINPLFTSVMSSRYQETFSLLYHYNIAISVLTCFIAFHINYAFQLKKRPKFQVYIGIVALIINLCLSLILVRVYGLVGVAYSTIVSQLFLIVVPAIYIRKYLK